MTGGWHPTQAIGPDGQRADVKDVANGLQCHCICFECGQPVLAKQGPKLRWHFAHHAPTNCRPTPEAELHFFAKTLLAERLWLWIPAVRANAAGLMQPISDPRQFEFSEVRVEKADGNVRPDLLLATVNGKILHVEIYVRHRVDPIKLEKLKSRGISSLEIDLSKLDWDDRDAWEVAILETAPREWLHNARAARVQQEMEARAASEARVKQQVLDAEYEKVADIWNEAMMSCGEPDEQLADQYKLAMKRGFSQKIGQAVMGSACFRVPSAYWQARLVNRFLWDEATTSPRAFETKDALTHVKDLIRPGLNYISKDTMARMQKEFPAFQSPWHVVHSYLKWLKEQHWMFDKRVLGKHWLPSSSAVYLRTEQEAAWQEEKERKEEVADWVDMILSGIPENETSGFDRASWVDWFVNAYDEQEARALHEAIYEMVVGGRQLADDLLGLPLLAEYERQEIAQEERRVQKQRERVARLAQVERDRRISTLHDKAKSVLGELGSGLIDQSQKMTVAARAMAEKKTVGQRS